MSIFCAIHTYIQYIHMYVTKRRTYSFASAPAVKGSGFFGGNSNFFLAQCMLGWTNQVSPLMEVN